MIESLVPETRISLIERAKAEAGGRMGPAKQQFCELYHPVILHWCRELGLQPSDAEDLSQELASLKLFAKIHAYQMEPGKRFRGWLKTVVRNYVKDFWRKAARRQHLLEDVWKTALASTHCSEALADEPYLMPPFIEKVMAQVEACVAPRTWEAFTRHHLQGQKATAVALDLGTTANVVLVSTSRVLKRLREEGMKWLDSVDEGKEPADVR